MSSRIKNRIEPPWKPTREQLAAAYGQCVPDVIGPNLKVLFIGINPGLYSAAVAHHFARPGNRFWPALHRSGFTPRLFSPFEELLLLEHGYGITNLVERGTAMASELTAAELMAGARRLARKVKRHRPKCVAFLGITSYRLALQEPKAVLGHQKPKMAATAIWVLPNPSGLNAHHQIADLAKLFSELRRFVERAC
jgi:TDG/mug DNA glycosylase family protein